ncbi:MAG: XylR N-terminal domain-containing protein [Moorellales bacterium]
MALTAEGLGLLRKDLVSVLGVTGARKFLTRFGWNCGFQDATAIKAMFPNIDPQDWYRGGARLHSRSGIVQVKMDVSWYDPASQTCYFEGEWLASLEAEQHVQLLGRSDDVVCWTLAGYASGYKSAVLGRDVLCVEVQCRGKGDATCRFVGKPVSDWGNEAAEHLEYYKPLQVVEELCQLYRKLDDTGPVKEAFQFQRTLSRLLTDGAGIETIVSHVAQWLKADVAVLNDGLDMICGYGAGLRSCLRLWEENGRCGLLADSGVSPGTFDLPGAGGGRYVLASPIRVGPETKGWLLVFRRTPFRETDIAICEQTAAVCFSLWPQAANSNAEKLVRQLFSETVDAQAWMRKAAGLGLREDSRYAAGIVEGANAALGVKFLTDILDRPLTWVAVADGAGYAILSEGEVVELERNRNRLEANCRKNGLYVSVGNPVPPSALPQSVEQARRAQAVLRTFLPEGGFLGYKEVQSYELLLPASGAREQIRAAWLLPVAAYDHQKQSDLLRTLEVYLSTESVSQTARLCNLHPSGVKYRLRKIERLLGTTLKDRWVRFNLQLALLLFRLNQES